MTVRNRQSCPIIESCVIHRLELPIQAQDLIKAYQTSTHFHDVYHYITDGKLPSGAKAQACIWAEALFLWLSTTFCLG